MSNRCGNCGRYPFCENTKGATDYCNNWIKRNIESEVKKGVNKDG